MTPNDIQEEQDEIPESEYLPDLLSQPIFRFDPAGIIALVIVWQIAGFWARMAGLKTPPTAVSYLLPHWRGFLPDEVWNLLPSFLLSWPLLAIQLLTQPLPFFGVALPLGLWLVPRLVLSRYAAFSTFRISYQGALALQNRRRGRYWRAIKRLQAYLFWFFAAGFLWPWLCTKGAFAAVLPGAKLFASARAWHGLGVDYSAV